MYHLLALRSKSNPKHDQCARKVLMLDQEGQYLDQMPDVHSKTWRIIGLVQGDTWEEFQHTLLAEARADRDTILVQAEMADGADRGNLRRAVRDTEAGDAGLREIEHSVLVLDLDDIDAFVPYSEDTREIQDKILKYLPALLPGYDINMPHVLQLTSKHGVKGPSKPARSRIRLWIPLDRPYPAPVIREFLNFANERGSKWARDTGLFPATAKDAVIFDPSVHTACQPVYINRPLVLQDDDDGMPWLPDEDIERWFTHQGDGLGQPYSIPTELLEAVEKKVTSHRQRGGLEGSAPGDPENSPTWRALRDQGMIKSRGNLGSWNVVCPNHEAHSQDSGESSTQFFQAHYNGYAKEGFRCMHAHCQGLGIREIRQMLGVSKHTFEELVDEFENHWVGLPNNSGSMVYMPEDGSPAVRYSFAGLKKLYAAYNRVIVGPRGGETQVSPADVATNRDSFRHVQEFTFQPGKPIIVDGMLNLWLDQSTRLPDMPSEDQAKNYRHHWQNLLETLFPEDVDRDWFLNWFGHMIQHPEDKPHTHLYHVAPQGLGRGSLIKIMKGVLNCGLPPSRELATTSTMKWLLDGYTDGIINKIFIGIEELSYAEGSREGMSQLRDILTREEMRLNIKGGRAGTLPDYSRFMICTNHRTSLDIPELGRRIWTVEVKDLPPQHERPDYAMLASLAKDPLFQVWLYQSMREFPLTDTNTKLNKGKPVDLIERGLYLSRKSECQRFITEALHWLQEAGIKAVTPTNLKELMLAIANEEIGVDQPIYTVDQLTGNYFKSMGAAMADNDWREAGRIREGNTILRRYVHRGFGIGSHGLNGKLINEEINSKRPLIIKEIKRLRE